MQSDDMKIVQRTLFAGPDPRVAPGMYLEANLALVRASRTRVRLEPGAVLSTDTYFGRFAASYWQRYTRVSSVRLAWSHDCAPGTTLRVEVKATDMNGRWRPIDTVEVSGDGSSSLDLPIDRYLDGGGIWFDVTAIGGAAEVSDVTWSVTPPDRERGLAVVMCTHNRPADATATLLTLASDPMALDLVDTVYVVDQGDRRVDADERFAQVRAAYGDRLHYVVQPNLGGAGGFNRGLLELTREGEDDVDIVVMDDDILCEPESVVRLAALSAGATRRMVVGAQMLLLSETYRVHMTSEWEALDQLKAGRPGARGKAGLNALEDKQDARTDAGWNGWWTCLLPSEAVRDAGLSLPLFFQWDDIEFGIRARKAGYTTVTLPNAGVWHADFHLKDYDDWSRYFSWRNTLIVAAVHSEFDGKHVSGIVAREIAGQIASMQYGLAETFLLAVRDFLAGPSVLADGGQSKPAELSALRAGYPDTVRRPAPDGLAGDPPITPRGPHPDEHSLDRVLAKRVVQQLLGRVVPGPVAIPAHDARWWHVGLFREAAVTDASQTGVRIRRRDKETAVRQGRELARLCWQLRRTAPQAAQQWRDALPTLTSRDNWQRLFAGD